MYSFNRKLASVFIWTAPGLQNALYEHIPHSCIHMVVKEMQRAIFDMRSMQGLDICVRCPSDRARQTGMSVIKRDAGDDNVTRAYEYACSACFWIVLHINKIIQIYMRVLTISHEELRTVSTCSKFTFIRLSCSFYFALDQILRIHFISPRTLH